MTHPYSSAWRVVLFATSLTSPAAIAEEPRPKDAVRVYGNQDLDRVHAQREETGSSSVPAVSEIAPRPSTRSPAARTSGEDFWRKEAEAHRARVAALQRSLAELQDKAAVKHPAPTYGRRTAAASPPPFDRRIAALQARIRDEETHFLDRARREGALPGWLR